MFYKDVELHNIEDLISVKGRPGLRMQRVPESVRITLNETAQVQMCHPACSEIRFVSHHPVSIELSCPEGVGGAEVFYGPFQSLERYAIRREKTVIAVSRPDQMDRYDSSRFPHFNFAPEVCRLMLSGDPMFLHGIVGKHRRPPHRSELPEMRYLAYGTSITQQGNATGPHLTYVQQTGIRLGADVINLGASGSAFCEPEMADYMAARPDWDFATLDISANMLKFPLDFFYSRASYMINALCRSNPQRLVACLTLFPYAGEFGDTFIGLEDQGSPDDFRRALHRAVEDCPYDNVHLIEGSEVLDDVAGLSPDLLHPGDQGMIFMGENLARRLKPLIPRYSG